MFRKIFTSLVFIYAIFSLTGCDIKKDFTFDVEKEFVIQNYPIKSYTTSGDISASQASSDFDKYKGDLDKVEIQSAKYFASYFSGTATQNISGHLKIGDISGNQSVDLATIPNVLLINIAAKEQSMDLSSAGQSKFNDLLLNSPYSARLYFDAATNEVPLTATMRFKFTFKVTYKRGFPYL
jgi:hypothetical protein